MFDTLKKDIFIGDRIVLYLTNSNEKPEGVVIEIGENFILLENDDSSKSRFFDKLIGGWDILKNSPTKKIISTPKQKNITENIPKSKNSNNDEVWIAMLAPTNNPQNPIPKTALPPVSNINKSPFSNIEIEITTLIRDGKYKEAMQKLNDNLKKPNIEDKYKSSFLLKKAQLYSTLKDPDNSEKVYEELIRFCEKSNELRKNNANALSHYCTELARLQAQKPEKRSLALDSLRKATIYNDKNKYAIRLLQQLEGTLYTRPLEGLGFSGEKIQEEGDLLVEAGDYINEISPMLKTDFEEHNFTHPSIIKNGGIPTSYIADSLIEEAKKLSTSDIGKRYLIYLDAAKAYKELAPGSYELENYLTAAASYAQFKGDLLYNKFKNEVLGNNTALDELIRLKDSACSYYLVSTNLLSTIAPNSLLKIITNYLIMSVVLHFHKNKKKTFTANVFNIEFMDLVKNCLTNQDKVLEKIVWITFIDLGALSSHAWNALSQLPGGTGNLYGNFFSQLPSRKRIYDLINSIWGWSIDTTLKSNQFLQTAFRERQKLENDFVRVTSNIRKISFEGEMIDQIIQSWNHVLKYENLLTDTDKETEKSINKALEIAKPYLKRNPIERTNILIEIQNIIEKQMDFINRNTTIYGRTYFFPLLSKWKKDISSLLKERIVASHPKLRIIVDPQYFYERNNEIFIPLIIENEGETTAEGYIINYVVKSIEGKSLDYNFKKEGRSEIPAGNKTEDIINAPIELIKHSQTISLDIEVEAIYQNDVMNPKKYQFTLGKESASNITIEDIPWQEGPIPIARLFKGREAIIEMLCKHYRSLDRGKPYILYGLTRTGKSSILKYLKDKIDGMIIGMQGQDKKVVVIDWDLSTAANYSKASEFWEYIVYEQSYHKLPHDIRKSILDFEMKRDARAKDFENIINCFKNAGYYPLVMVDEFSYIKNLIDRKVIQPAFLASLRQFSLNNQAGFIFAGTYDIKELIENPAYGITGQLVHAIDYQIDKIDDRAAEELITILEKLKFTHEAIAQIKKLSGNIPYFIQIICKYCGYYAVENKRLSIGYPELEKVIRVLSGLDDSKNDSILRKLPENVFQNNQYGPGDPNIVPALVSSIAWFNRESLVNPRGVRMSELEKLWIDSNVTGARPKLAEAVKILSDKKIITSEDDEGDRVYNISVDLFRRWWSCHYPDIKLALASISE